MTAARHIAACRERGERLDGHMVDLTQRQKRGEEVFPPLQQAEYAALATYDAEIAAGDLILTTAARTEAEALVQLGVVARRLGLMAGSVPTDATPAEAERIELAVLSALTALRHRADAAVARFLDDCAELHLDVLHHEPPAVPAEAAD